MNTCQISQKCSEEANKKPPSEVTIENNTVEEVSEIPDPVGPFFDQTSESSTKLDVFTVKTPPTTPKSPIKDLKPESQLVVAGKCGVILTVPSLLVALLYLLMTLQAENSNNSLETASNLWPNFNETRLSSSENLLKIQKNNSKQAEIDRILRNVYIVINKFQEEHKDVKIPTVRGQFLFKSPPQNVTTNCLEDPTTLKAFDLFTVVLGFFAVVFYTKLTEVKLPKTDWSLNVNKCIVAFSMLWTPEMIETLVSRLITVKQPNIFSAVLLLVGNLERVYAAKRNISMYKSNFCKMNAFIKPQ